MKIDCGCKKPSEVTAESLAFGTVFEGTVEAGGKLEGRFLLMKTNYNRNTSTPYYLDLRTGRFSAFDVISVDKVFPNATLVCEPEEED